MRDRIIFRPTPGLKRQPSTALKQLRSCVKSRWPSWAPVPNQPTVSVDVKQHSTNSGFTAADVGEGGGGGVGLNFCLCEPHSIAVRRKLKFSFRREFERFR